jgi:integrase
MAKRRNWSEGSIVARGLDSWRLRFWHGGKRHSVTFKGTKADAREELRRLLHAGDVGEHIDPTRLSVGQWCERWLELGAPGRKGQKAGARTLVRYGSLLRSHVIPELGQLRLQKLSGAAIDDMYTALAAKDLAPRTRHHVRVVLGGCLGAAVRAGLLRANPMLRALKTPSVEESDHGIALSDDDLRRLVTGFRGGTIELIVAVAAYAGARRNEILALRWGDLDAAAKTLRIERAVEKIRGTVTFKAPKSKRGIRTIDIDDNLLGLLVAEREKHQRLVAGITDGSAVDLSLIKLPADALMFPSPLGKDLVTPRDPDAVTRIFVRRARKLGFGEFRLHDLRGSHGTNLLRKGVPVDVVARRLGHDPVTLLRAYAKPLETDSQIVREALKAMLPTGK